MAEDKLFYYQLLALYGILDAVILYLTFSVITPDNRTTMYALFIFLLGYSIFGLWLLTEELDSNYGVTSKTIDFSNKSGGNIQKLTSWALIAANVIAICIYAYGIVMNSNFSEAKSSSLTENNALARGTPARTPAPTPLKSAMKPQKPSVGFVGGGKRK